MVDAAVSNGKSLDEMRMIADTLTNVLSGLGGSGDKTAFARFGFPFLMFDRSQLEMAYRGDWIARKVVDLPAKDSTREWRTWQADTADITKIEAAEKKFSLQYKTAIASSRGRLYGGAVILIGTEGDQSKPLEVEKVKKDDLKFLHVVNRFQLAAGPIEYDITSPWFGQPQYYSRTLPNLIQIHPSRVVRFMGNELPDPLGGIDIGNSAGWSDSVLTTVNDAMIGAGLVVASGATMVQEMNYDVIKIPGLSQRVTTKEYENQLIKRFQIAANAKSTVKSILLDKEEDWQRISTALTGLPDTVKLYLLIASAAADIPATRFLAQSPAGLSATGESDTRNYYDRLSSDQAMMLTPAMNVLDEVMIRSALGANPDGIYFDWNPLWQLDDLQNAQRDYQRAQTWQIDVGSGLMPEDVLREARYNQLIEDGTYPGMEDVLDEFGREPDPTETPDPVPPVDPNAPPPPTPGQNNPPPNAKTPPPTAKATDFDRMRERASRLLAKDAKVRFARRKKGRFTSDAEPRTMYMRRDVTNATAILAHFRRQGVENLVPADQLHVTIAYSKTAFDWMCVPNGTWGQNEDGTMTIPPGGIRLCDPLGAENVTALLFTSSYLSWRHEEICCAGASWDYQSYQPHMTVAIGMTKDQIRALEPWQGAIELGPEIAEEIVGSFTYGEE